MKERIICRLCNGALKTVYELCPTPLANSFPSEPDIDAQRYPLRLKQCVDCSHVQLAHVPHGLYDSYKYQTPIAQKPALEARAQELVRLYTRHINVCEIGANNGLFTWALRDAGFDTVVGVDPTPHDGSIWPGFFNPDEAWRIKKRFGRFKLILANNVLAHIDDFDEVISAVDLLLDDKGVLVFEVQYLPDLLNHGYFDMIYHEHHDYHHLSPLFTYFKKIGYALSFEHIDNHGGSIRVTVRKNGGVDRPEVIEILNWSKFDDLVKSTKHWMRDNLHGKVAAFGATAKSCTLIHHCELQDRISYMVDETPTKIDRYIAGTNIRVCSPDKLKEEPPDTLLLTAWNYADILRKRFPELNVVVPFENFRTDTYALAS